MVSGAWAQSLPTMEGAGEVYLSRKVVAGDRLRITVKEDARISGEYTVAGDGTIDFGYLGRVSVADRTVAEVGDTLKRMLEQTFFKTATVSVEVSEYVEGAILVMGAVGHTGQIPYRGDQAITLLDAIVMSGGLARGAAGTEVRILRLKPGAGMQRETLTVDVQSMFEDLDFSKDQYLRPRDIIFVPSLGEGEEGAAEFLALGAVGSPGFHPYSEGLDVIRAVMRAGGFSRDGAWDSARILRPDKTGRYSIVPINLLRLFGAAEMAENIPVYAGDILFIPLSQQASRGQVYLLGEVGKPGPINLPLSQNVTLAKTILASGGLGKFANDSKVKIIRTAPNGTKQTLYVDVGRILKTGAFEDDVPLEDGDVIIVPEKLLSF